MFNLKKMEIITLINKEYGLNKVNNELDLF